MGKTGVDIEGISSSHKAMFGGAVEVMNRPSTVSIVLSPAHHGIRPTQFPQSILPTPVVSPSQRRLYVLSGWSPSPSCAGFGASNEAFWVLRKLFLLVNDLVERKEEDKEEVECGGGGDGKDPRKAKKKKRQKKEKTEK